MTPDTTTPAVHFIFISKNHLRGLENELADGIVSELPGWEESREELRIRRGAVNVTFFITRRGHVMMSHGVADKNYLLRTDAAGGLEVNKYRTVCVPGPWMQRKMEAHPEVTVRNIRCVGWPRLDKLLAAQKLRPAVPRDDRSKPKVLWAPTHPGRGKPNQDTRQRASYPALNEYVDRMRDVFDLEISLHPANRGGGRSTFEQLLDADYVIADRGTTLYEAWALGKPVIFPRWILGDATQEQTPGSAEAEIYARRLGIHADSFDDMVQSILSRPTVTADVQAFMEDYLPSSTHGKSYQLLAQCVQETWDTGKLKLGVKAAALA